MSCGVEQEMKDNRSPLPSSTPPPGGCEGTVTFNDNLAPILAGKCVSCHPGFDKYDTAKTKIDQYIRRISLGANDPQRMPKSPNPELSGDEKKIFSDWRDQGFKKDCDDDGNTQIPFSDLGYVELAIQKDLNSLSSGDQREARYLLTTHKANEGGTPEVMKQFRNAVNKGINSLSFSRAIVLAKPIDQYKTVWRFFLRDLRLNANDWRIVEDADVINFESFTNLGLLNKFLTNTRKPFMHVDTFNFTAFQAKQYYRLRKLPSTERQLFIDIGADVVGDIRDFDAIFLGFSDSPISLQKPRLISGFEIPDGVLWITFDSLLNQNDPNRNPFNRPLVIAPSGENLVFDGSESIFSLQNGLLAGFFLADGQGRRVDEAPVNLVSDNISPFSPVINILSCSQCHNAGFIKNNDEILNHVLQNAVSFDPDDVDAVRGLYRPAGNRLEEDSAEHVAALAKMDVSPDDKDPVNQSSDNLRRNVRAKELAAFLLLKENELLAGIAGSAALRSSIGQLLTGGDVTFEVLKQEMPTILKDLRIGQDPIIP